MYKTDRYLATTTHVQNWQVPRYHPWISCRILEPLSYENVILSNLWFGILRCGNKDTLFVKVNISCYHQAQSWQFLPVVVVVVFHMPGSARWLTLGRSPCRSTLFIIIFIYFVLLLLLSSSSTWNRLPFFGRRGRLPFWAGEVECLFLFVFLQGR